MEIAPLAARGLYPQVPPEYESRQEINPTLMMSWWATGFSLAIIVVRLCGRYVRIERFFPEDKIMMLSVIPLTIRMVLVHFVLAYGTNNVQTAGLTSYEIEKRAIGSKLVLASRIFYAIFIWTAKLTVCEFLKRVTGVVWRRSVAIFLRFIHFFLISTLVAVVIATLAECQPFDHYWQVIPDPGPRCRSGYAQLITMGTCDVITDLLLIAFPVPIILLAQMPLKRKLALVFLFCLSLVLVGITCYRVPSVIERRGNQPYRSLIASLEILAATAVSNAVVIGSFVRDRGSKSSIMKHQWGSDSDLAADMGIRLDPKLHSSTPGAGIPIPAPPVPLLVAQTGALDRNWTFHQGRPSEDDRISAADSLDIKVSPREYIPTNKSPRDQQSSSPSPLSSDAVPFFDVGGLLDQEQPQSNDLHTRPHPVVVTPSSDDSPEIHRPRRGSRAFLEDIGVLAPRSPPGRFSSPPAPISETAAQLSHTLPPYRASPDTSIDVDIELQDVGGLLSRRNPDA
ncbi:hypothetical protein N7462_005800 [Penicillium macrosclerotiorum]|uniref:uncharacterized protein n=1 Tax=Penicillium macrosclerotiorum TaxID=303699 RepID=UPI0025485892|nr:uncharacterized protein N7462_005800 [Penicillium macrosclerotiorum]KAJ5682635.1 hypothetical protein N7462_005800 [Penicillium macrosclerotiorum]